jgi:WD40 repeat protein
MNRWDTTQAKRDGEIKGADWVTFTAGAPGLITSASDRKLRFFPETERSPSKTWDAAGDAVHALAISPDGKLGASGAADGTVSIFALPEGKNVRTFVAAP